MELMPIDRKVLGLISELQGDGGVHYSAIGDLVTDSIAVRVLTSLEIKGLIQLRGGRVWLTAAGAAACGEFSDASRVFRGL